MVPLVAVITAAVAVVTAVVVTVNVPLDAPAAIDTLAGTAATALSLDRFTTTPPVGAGEPRVTVPVTLAPPLTAVGFTETPVRTPAGTEIDFAVSMLPATSTLQ